TDSDVRFRYRNNLVVVAYELPIPAVHFVQNVNITVLSREVERDKEGEICTKNISFHQLTYWFGAKIE
ncbi:hypothetical protein, partial [Bacteroides heparinolyticus]|uniref:hypothetical protein n=1 Tax=Prevotella heparinolytica TaxID=28113 RepID=UPI0035A0B14B